MLLFFYLVYHMSPSEIATLEALLAPLLAIRERVREIEAQAQAEHQ